MTFFKLTGRTPAQTQVARDLLAPYGWTSSTVAWDVEPGEVLERINGHLAEMTGRQSGRVALQSLKRAVMTAAFDQAVAEDGPVDPKLAEMLTDPRPEQADLDAEAEALATPPAPQLLPSQMSKTELCTLLDSRKAPSLSREERRRLGRALHVAAGLIQASDLDLDPELVEAQLASWLKYIPTA